MNDALFRFVKKIKKPTAILLMGGVVLVGGVSVYVVNKKGELSREFVTARRSQITQEILATGIINSPTIIDLQFKNNGKLAILKVEVGQEVSSGEFLAQQDIGVLNAQLSEMQAGIDVAKAQLKNYEMVVEVHSAKLEELKRGARPEEVRVKEVKVENAKKNLINRLQDAYTKSDNAVRNKIDPMFNSPRSSDPQIIFSINNFQLEIDIEWQRMSIENTLKSWSSLLGEMSFEDTKQNLDQIKLFLDKMALAINSVSVDSALSQTTLDGYKSDVSTARANINTAIVNLLSAKSNTDLAESELALTKAGTVSEQITAQEAQVEQAKANVILQEARVCQAEASAQIIREQIKERILVAPINGIVTEKNGDVGEMIPSNQIIISIMPEGNLQIDANVSEEKIINIKTGGKVRITLDAFGNDVEWNGRVVKIDPAEKVVAGAIYYKTTVFFDNGNKHIKSGMTANVWFQTVSKENVLIVPIASIRKENNKNYIEILEGKKIRRKEIITGLKDSKGFVEIVSGLDEGDKVIISH